MHRFPSPRLRALLPALVLAALLLSPAALAAGETDLPLNDPAVTIAVPVGAVPETAAKAAYPDADFIYINSASDGFLAIQTGKADAFAVERTSYDSAVAAGLEGLALHSDGAIGEPGLVAVGISPLTEIPDAKGKIDAFLQEMEEEGVLREMEDRWLRDRDYTMPDIPQAEDPDFSMTVGTSGLAEPYTFYQDNTVTGFDVELMRRFALWCNASVTFALYDWNGLTASCVSGKTDYIAADLFVTPEKQEVIGFSQPYTQAETVMVVAAESGRGGFWSGLADSFQRTFLRENRWQLILSGLWVTVEITLLAALAGTALGFGLYLLLACPLRPVRLLLRGFCSLLQGLPSLVVLMILYFLVFASSDIRPVLVGVIAFSLLFAVTVSQLLASGVRAVDGGQWEAAEALGFGRAGAFFHVILPQALRHAMPLYKGELSAMLMESMLAVIALIAVASFASTAEAAALGYTTPTQIFAGGVAAFLTTVGLPQGVVYTLINLAVSAFALTSLDSVARVGRLSFQELFLDESIRDEDMGPVRRVLTNKYFATVLTLALAYLLAKAGYASIWPLFGASNQLLSALAFLACAVFLKRTKRKSFMLWIPMFAMIAATFSALAITIWNLGSGIAGGTYRWVSGMTVTVDGASVLTAWGAGLQLLFAVLILALGVVVVIQGVRKLLEKAPAAR